MTNPHLGVRLSIQIRLLYQLRRSVSLHRNGDKISAACIEAQTAAGIVGSDHCKAVADVRGTAGA